MELSDVQKETVREWVREGAGLSEVQRRLSSKFEVSMTYMEVRFLVLDLDVDIQEDDAPAAQAAGETAVEDESGIPLEPETLPPAPGGDGLLSGKVTVDVDRVVQAGSLASGQVTFSDGVSTRWALDQFGRLALDGADPDYRPSPEDLQAFQEELQTALASRGI